MATKMFELVNGGDVSQVISVLNLERKGDMIYRPGGEAYVGSISQPTTMPGRTFLHIRALFSDVIEAAGECPYLSPFHPGGI